jgi:glyoxylase-like metal-dependent hydrolase (beta-lactamase superfamily II)
MASVCEITDGIYQIEPEGIERGIPSMVYFIDDDKKAIIETGPTSQIPQVLEALKTLGCDASSLSYIIPTHIHIDHGGGIGSLIKHTTKAKVIAHPQGAYHMKEPSRLIEGIRMAFGDGFEEEFGHILPIPQSMIQIAEDEEIIPLGQRNLKIIHTHGHAPHHICIYDTKSEGLFCGDELGGYLPETDTLISGAAPPLFALDKNLENIDRIRRLSPKMLLFSQFGVGKDVTGILKRVQDTNKALGEIILKGLNAGENRILIQKKLALFTKGTENIRYKLLREKVKDYIIPAYTAYFKSKGMISSMR